MCDHTNFMIEGKVARIGPDKPEEQVKFMAEVKVVCLECGQYFKFKGLRSGISFNNPMTDLIGTELFAPIEPGEFLGKPVLKDITTKPTS